MEHIYLGEISFLSTDCFFCFFQISVTGPPSDINNPSDSHFNALMIFLFQLFCRVPVYPHETLYSSVPSLPCYPSPIFTVSYLYLKPPPPAFGFAIVLFIAPTIKVDAFSQSVDKESCYFEMHILCVRI